MIEQKRDRIGIVGATSLLGKELAEELADSPLAAAEVVLLEQDATEGQISAAGDEAAFVQALDAESFAGLDLVFFAGAPELTREYWQQARQSGAVVVDLSHALVGEPGVLLRAPAVSEALAERGLADGTPPGLETAAVVVAHPFATALALLAARLYPALERMTATVLLPASEHGRAALDELHQQTVNLLSFHELPRAQFDAQTAFNLLPSFGEDAAADLRRAQREIADDYRGLGAGRLPALLLQVVQAPVFHGYTASVLLDLREAEGREPLLERLRGRHLVLTSEEDDPPSNLAAAGQRDVLVQAAAGTVGETPLWLWVAADNLKLRAAGAIACAVELRRLRPMGKVQ